MAARPASASASELDASEKLAQARESFRSDPARSIALYKEIAANRDYPCALRGEALQYLADAFLNGSRSSSAAQAVFRDASYAAILGSSRDLREAVTRIYQRALALGPRPVSYYRVAEWHLEALSRSSAPAERQRHLGAARANLAYGNETFRCCGMSKGQRAYAYWLRGRVLGALSQADSRQDYRAAAEKSFLKALALLGDSGPSGHRAWAALYYTVFLYEAYGMQRLTDIRAAVELLRRPEGRGSSAVKFIAGLARSPEHDPRLAETLNALGRGSPEFSAFLREVRTSAVTENVGK